MAVITAVADGDGEHLRWCCYCAKTYSTARGQPWCCMSRWYAEHPKRIARDGTVTDLTDGGGMGYASG